MEAGGIEPEAIENEELATSGQNRSPTGQVESDAGQPPGFAADTERADRTPTGQNESSCGHFSAPTEPPLSSPDLRIILKAWPHLPGAVKRGILAMVKTLYPPRGPSHGERAERH